MVAELGPTAADDQIYRLTYDGSVADEDSYAVMGGSVDAITTAVKQGYQGGLELAAAVQLAVQALAVELFLLHQDVEFAHAASGVGSGGWGGHMGV